MFFKTDETKITLEKNINGKPYIKNGECFHFNISHTKNALAIAISSKPIGIDIERLKAPDLRVAERFFTDKENKYIKECDIEKRFFELWTKKEAYIKKEGLNLSYLRKANTESCITVFEGEYVISVCSEENINLSDIVLEKLKHM